MPTFDYLIIGGGIVGCTVANEIILQKPHATVAILDQEKHLGLHASGNNSGVVHAGIYYKPGSKKAQLAVQGNELMRKFVADNSIEYEKCGKVIVSKSIDELPNLDALFSRGIENGASLQMVDQKHLKELNPFARTLDRAIWSPNTAVANPRTLLETLKKIIETAGVQVLTDHKVKFIDGKSVFLQSGERFVARSSILNAAGTGALAIARKQGIGNNYRLTPFAGYYKYLSSKAYSPTHIYPVPDPKFPFLGVHITKSSSALLKVGPTALPRIRSYASPATKTNLDQAIDAGLGFINFGLRSPVSSLGLLTHELLLTSDSYVQSELSKIYSGPVSFARMDKKEFGIRAQLLDKNTGQLVDDFVLEEVDGVFHLINGVSPGWTSAFSFAKYLFKKMESFA